jgi:uncharacterized repeat protein (TIGR03803 family)
MLLDQLESRVMLSASNHGYAFTAVAPFSFMDTQAEGPSGPLVEDSQGNFFGTADSGGADFDGAVFEIPATGPNAGSVVTIASFNGTDGQDPSTGLAIDSAGNLYGTTANGGLNGTGTVFEVAASNLNTINLLGSFSSGVGGVGDVAVDASGNVFGFTGLGGAHGTGSVYEIPAGASDLNHVGGNGSATTIASFAATSGGVNATGVNPVSTPDIVDDNIYGASDSGGSDSDGDIFMVPTSGGTITDVANFTTDTVVNGNIIFNGENLFAASRFGGAHSDGFILELPEGSTTVSTLASFAGTNGTNPDGELYQDSNGDLFGTTVFGGASSEGTAFEMPTTGVSANTIETLESFTGGTDGGLPASGIIADSNGNLFGTASSNGGGANGEFFELTPVHLVVSGVPTLFSDTPDTISPTVTLEGPTGNTITNDDSLVTLAINNGGALSFDTAISSGGVATFNDLAVTTPGSGFVLTATDANSDASGTSESFTVAPQPADTSTHLVFLTQPVYNKGEIPTVAVGIENSSGAIVATDNSIVALGEDSGPGDFGGTLDVQAVDGVATFTDLNVDEAGTYKITASDHALTTATSKPFLVPAVPSSIEIVSNPTDPLIAGVKSVDNVVVAVFDQFDNPVGKGSATVRLGAIGLEGGKSITLATATEVNGVATFKNVKMDEAGIFILGATSTGFTSNFVEIEVEPAAATKLAFVLGPPDTTSGAPFSLSVELLDSFGNVVTTDNSSTITLSLTGGSAGTLGGTKTLTVSDGVANFGGLSVSKAGHYQIIATDNALHKSITSRNFKVA